MNSPVSVFASVSYLHLRRCFIYTLFYQEASFPPPKSLPESYSESRIVGGWRKSDLEDDVTLSEPNSLEQFTFFLPSPTFFFFFLLRPHPANLLFCCLEFCRLSHCGQYSPCWKWNEQSNRKRHRYLLTDGISRKPLQSKMWRDT